MNVYQIADFIKKQRKKKKMSRQCLADLSSLSRLQVRSIEELQFEIKVSYLIRILDVFGYKIELVKKHN